MRGGGLGKECRKYKFCRVNNMFLCIAHRHRRWTVSPKALEYLHLSELISSSASSTSFSTSDTVFVFIIFFVLCLLCV